MKRVGNVSMQARCVLTHVPLQQAIKKKSDGRDLDGSNWQCLVFSFS